MTRSAYIEEEYEDEEDYEDEEEEDDYIDARDLEDLLRSAIEDYADMPSVSVSTFGDVGAFTLNRGLVLRFKDSEFQLTIVRSK